MKLIITEIRETLPHRYSFLLLGSVEEVIPRGCAIAKKDVAVSEQIFQGHFSGDPVLLGVLIVESLAQAGAVTLLSTPEFKEGTTYFGGLDRAELRQKVTSGDTLILEVELLEVRASAGMGRSVVKVSGKRIAEAELISTIG